MAEKEEVADGGLLQSPPPPPSFLEVSCKNSGKVRRFASGTESRFALYLINKKLDIGVPPASYIEAVKEGEEPVNFGPTSVLTDYGHGWKLQTVTEEVPGKEKEVQPIYKQNPTEPNPTVMRSDGLSPAGSSMGTLNSHISYLYIGRILLALVLIFLLGGTFTLVLENLPRLILLFTSSM